LDSLVLQKFDQLPKGLTQITRSGATG
jgi:hypothetical protein